MTPEAVAKEAIGANRPSRRFTPLLFTCFSNNLKSVKFVGDGTYLEFTDKYVEIRPSGTDAKTKAYAGGEDLEMIEKFSRVLGNYSGDRTELHKELISDEFYENSKEKALDYYLQFVEKDANNEVFVIPEYKF